MRAAVVREPLGPFVVEEVRDPEPARGEILVQVSACGVCHTDLHVHDGSVKFPFPCVLGHEISGTVLEIGDDVSGVTAGDRVVAGFIMPCGECTQCRAGREELCGPFFEHNRLNGTLYDGRTRLFDAQGLPLAMYSMGGLSEKAVMPALAAARLPDDLPLVDSAVLGCAMLTAYGACRHTAELQDGETVAVVGVGGVGTGIIQVARALGASEVIAIDVADDKLEAARAAGATVTINGAVTEPVALVHELTDGLGVDVAFEAVGSPATFRQATDLLSDGGRCVMIGIAPAAVFGEVELIRLVRRELRILGSFGGRPRNDLVELTRMATSGQLDLGSVISRRFTIDETDHAYHELAEGKILGRAIIEMDD